MRALALASAFVNVVLVACGESPAGALPESDAGAELDAPRDAKDADGLHPDVGDASQPQDDAAAATPDVHVPIVCGMGAPPHFTYLPTPQRPRLRGVYPAGVAANGVAYLSAAGPMRQLASGVFARDGGYDGYYGRETVRIVDHVVTQVLPGPEGELGGMRMISAGPDSWIPSARRYRYTGHDIKAPLGYSTPGPLCLRDIAGPDGTGDMRVSIGEPEQGVGPTWYDFLAIARLKSSTCLASYGSVPDGRTAHCDGLPPVAAGDFDLDGKLDVVVSGLLMRAFESQCALTSEPPGEVANGEYQGTIEPLDDGPVWALDISGDGHQDLIMGDVPWITAAGGPIRSPDALAGRGTLVAALDVDGDGIQDGVFATGGVTRVELLGASGAVSRTIWLPAWVTADARLHADDLNGDGHRDLVVDSDAAGGILWGNAEGGYTAARSIDGHGAVVVPYADHDGILTEEALLDLRPVLAGPGAAPGSQPAPVTSKAGNAWAADFNGDGLLDFAGVASYQTDVPVSQADSYTDTYTFVLDQDAPGWLSVAFGTPGGSFNSTSTPVKLMTASVVDTDGDGVDELLAPDDFDVYDYLQQQVSQPGLESLWPCYIPAWPLQGARLVSVLRPMPGGSVLKQAVDVQYRDGIGSTYEAMWMAFWENQALSRVVLGDLTRDGVPDLVWEKRRVRPVDGDAEGQYDPSYCFYVGAWGVVRRSLTVMDGLSEGMVDSTMDIGSEWLLYDLDHDGFPEVIDLVPPYDGVRATGAPFVDKPTTLRVRATRPGLKADDPEVLSERGRTKNSLFLEPTTSVDLGVLRPGAQLIVEDLDGDGCAEIIIADKTLRPTRSVFRGDPDTFGRLLVYRYTSAGEVALAATLPLPGDTRNVLPADLDGDGDKDLVVEADGLLVIRNDTPH